MSLAPDSSKDDAKVAQAGFQAEFFANACDDVYMITVSGPAGAECIQSPSETKAMRLLSIPDGCTNEYFPSLA